MGIEKQGAKPSGRMGNFMGKLMNQFHTGFYRKYYAKVLSEEAKSILDIGCGGGSFIQFLSKKSAEYTLFGIDHSPEMVGMSEKVNKDAVKSGQVKISEASVMELPYDNESMHLVTAHETLQFWPDMEKSFAEVYRVLKKGGEFMIINNYPKEGTKWWKIAKLKDADAFVSAFKKAKFEVINIDLKTKKRFIIATAQK
jgi:ubiquinone/menaquinone biosynthesis C-methylase UbiE